MTQLPDLPSISLPLDSNASSTLTSLQTHEGLIPFTHPTIPPTLKCHTYYKVISPSPFPSPSSTNPPPPPLIILHGGPGACHNYLLNLSRLASHHQRTVIFYDQLGNGRSTHLRHLRLENKFWTPGLFVAELENLVRFLGLGDHSGEGCGRGDREGEGKGKGKVSEYDILGQSWGGMLGALFASGRPKGLRRLVVSNSPASMGLWVESCKWWIAELPEGVRRAIEEGERRGDWESGAYQEAVMLFYKRHLCRVWPFPPDVQASLEWLAKDDTVYMTMNGPSEFTVIGNLKDWDSRPFLDKIDIPTLVLNAQFDEARDSCVYPWFEGIKKCRWYTFPGLSHMSNVEDVEAYVKIVEGFLSGEVGES